MKYVGLTDDAGTRKQQHGNPNDWWQRNFQAEKEARDWEKGMLSRTGGAGWRYGYTYTITSSTSE